MGDKGNGDKWGMGQRECRMDKEGMGDKGWREGWKEKGEVVENRVDCENTEIKRKVDCDPIANARSCGDIPCRKIQVEEHW